MFKPRRSPFIAEFAHIQLYSARAREITDRINGEGLGSEASPKAGSQNTKIDEDLPPMNIETVIMNIFSVHTFVPLSL